MDGHILETERLLLRPMRAEDVDELLAVFADPLVMAAFDGILFDRAQMTGWVQRNLEHQKQYGYGLFSIVYKANDSVIGDCGLENTEVKGIPETELGYDLRSDYWNQGLATEAALAVRNYAFQGLKLPRLISLIRQGNRRSQRVAEKVGMHLSAELTRYGNAYWLYSISAADLHSL